MRKASVYVNGDHAGILSEIIKGSAYAFEYQEGYAGLEVSRTMLTDKRIYKYDKFPPFFEGLLPEGNQLEGLLTIRKVDRNDFFSQLMAVGEDLIGVVTVKELPA